MFSRFLIACLVACALSAEPKENDKHNGKGKGPPTIPEGMYLTHKGLFPKECVHQVKSDNHKIIHMDNGTYEIYPETGEKIFHPRNPKCIEHAKKYNHEYTNLAKKFEERANNKNSKHKGNNTSSSLSGEYGDQENWQVFALADGLSSVYELVGYYQIPDYYPSSSYDNQLLYWNMALQGTYSSYTWSLEPLITYCGSSSSYSSVCNDTFPSLYGFIVAECCCGGELYYGTAHSISVGATQISVEHVTGTSTSYTYMGYGGSTSTLSLEYSVSVDWDIVAIAAAIPEYEDSYSCSALPYGDFWAYSMYAYDYSSNYISSSWKSFAYNDCNSKVDGTSLSLIDGQIGVELRS